MAFKHEVHERKQETERTDRWHAEVDGYDVGLTRREDGFTEVYIAPINYEGLRLPLLRFHPKLLSDIENVVALLPKLLGAVIEECKAAGLTDFRSRLDLMMEESNRERERWLKELREASAAPSSPETKCPNRTS